MKPALTSLLILPILLSLVSCTRQQFPTEYQLTHGDTNHVLTNINVWSPDSQWLVFDIRSRDAAFDSPSIQRINIHTRTTEILYTAPNNAKVAVVTCDPKSNRSVFIQSPENPTPDWTYAAMRRRGIIIDANNPNHPIPLDAADYAPPFTPGALRGGTHVHVFSPDGQLLSSTYEDQVLHQLDTTPDSPPHHPNQRNIALHIPSPTTITPPPTHPRNHPGTYFSILGTSTAASPKPGSDEISRAFEEGWIGNNGYLRPDGSRQKYALAFQGLVTATDGSKHAEVFVLDLPENLSDLTQPQSPDKPLAGTSTTLPNPPKNIIQRRLTFTTNGLATTPRHWLRASPDGSQIAFLMNDADNLPQLFLVSPNGGSPRQLTHLKTPVASAFTWSPDGKKIALITGDSPTLIDTATGISISLLPPRPDAPLESFACVFSPDGQKIAYTRKLSNKAHIFYLQLPQN